MEITIYQNEEFYTKMAFDALDYNNDGFVSEIDLFLTIKDLENKHSDSEVSQMHSRLMDDIVKIVQYIKDKKQLKGTNDECKIRYENIIKKIQRNNVSFINTTSSLDKEDEEKQFKNFFEFATVALSQSHRKISL
jgi:hypothetical protein